MIVNVIGLGYIGLPTALMLSANGVDVVGTDCNLELVNILNSGDITFEEKGLKKLYGIAVKNGIKFCSDYECADIYIISVPTPYDDTSKKVDPSFVIAAVCSVLERCKNGAIIVIESTIAPGTIKQYIEPLLSEYGFIPNVDVYLAHAPERIIPGNMIFELQNNNRTIGADNFEIGEKIKSLYSVFCRGHIVVTDIKTAEMSKVVENTYRAINIAFANELLKICQLVDINVYDLIKVCNMHPRVNILSPGPGVGGHCIPVDPWFLVGEYPLETKLINDALEINAQMPEYVLNRIYEIMQKTGIEDLNRVGLYGLTYKENVDDIRESPSLQLLDCQRRHLALPLKVYDPFITTQIVENQYYNFDSFLSAVDLVVIMVKHKELCDNIEKLRGKVVLDCQNICNLEGTYYL